MTEMANAYTSLFLELPVSDSPQKIIYSCETNRRRHPEEGYGMPWAVIILRRGETWWVSSVPGALEDILRLLQPNREPATGFSPHFAEGIHGILSACGLDVKSYAHTMCYTPSGPSPSFQTNAIIRPISPSDDVSKFGYGVPEESVAYGTAFGAFLDGDIVGYAEATPLPTVTAKTGVMLVGIATVEGFRRKGLGQGMLSSVTNHVLGLGKLPWYHCSSSNTASQRTALSCGYTPYGEILRYHL